MFVLELLKCRWEDEVLLEDDDDVDEVDDTFPWFEVVTGGVELTRIFLLASWKIINRFNG